MNKLISVILAKYILMIALVGIYIPLFKYLCGGFSFNIFQGNVILIEDAYQYLIQSLHSIIPTYSSNNILLYSSYQALNVCDFTTIWHSASYNISSETCHYYNLFYSNEVKIFNFAKEYLQTNILKELYFTTSTIVDDLIFYPLQKKIYISFNETSLIFFRMINNTNEVLYGVSTYTVFPNEYLPYLQKLQCFCFEELRLQPLESVDLPVLFYIQPHASSDTKLTLCYTFLKINS